MRQASKPNTVSLAELIPLNRHPLIFQTTDGPQFLSAASGVVWNNNKIYIIADDDLRLGIIDADTGESSLEAILPGSLPAAKKSRKKQKPDFESLFFLEEERLPHPGLIAFPSGSTAKRFTAVYVPLLAKGMINSSQIIQFNLGPIFTPILAADGHLNIEAALIDGDSLVLFHRGNSGLDVNRIFEFDKTEFVSLILGKNTKTAIHPHRMEVIELGNFDGIKLAFTDATIFEGRRFFIAAAEDTSNSIDDGEIKGTVFGELSASGQLNFLASLSKLKAEGLAMRRLSAGVELTLVTDNDDPDHPSEMLKFVVDIS